MANIQFAGRMVRFVLVIAAAGAAWLFFRDLGPLGWRAAAFLPLMILTGSFAILLMQRSRERDSIAGGSHNDSGGK